MARVLSSLLGLLLLAGSGCYLGETTTQQTFPEEAMGKLVPGKTTAQEVSNLLGAPTSVVELGTNSAWLYQHIVSKDAGIWALVIALHGNDTQSDRIWVFFNAQGTLTHAAASFEAGDARFSMPPMK